MKDKKSTKKIRTIIYDGEEVDCEVSIDYKLVILWGLIIIVAPLFFTYLGAYLTAGFFFIVGTFGVFIGGDSAFMNFTPVKKK